MINLMRMGGFIVSLVVMLFFLLLPISFLILLAKDSVKNKRSWVIFLVLAFIFSMAYYVIWGAFAFKTTEIGAIYTWFFGGILPGSIALLSSTIFVALKNRTTK